MKPCPIWRTSANILYDYRAILVIQKFTKHNPVLETWYFKKLEFLSGHAQ